MFAWNAATDTYGRDGEGTIRLSAPRSAAANSASGTERRSGIPEAGSDIGSTVVSIPYIRF
jgi:hypothetical protein